jgi:hypothetical protein
MIVSIAVRVEDKPDVEVEHSNMLSPITLRLGAVSVHMNEGEALQVAGLLNRAVQELELIREDKDDK